MTKSSSHYEITGMSYRYSAHSCQLADRTKSGKAIPQWPQPGGPDSVEFELPGDKAVLHRDGNRLVIEPVRKRGLIAPLKSMKPIEERFLKSTIRDGAGEHVLTPYMLPVDAFLLSTNLAEC